MITGFVNGLGVTISNGKPNKRFTCFNCNKTFRTIALMKNKSKQPSSHVWWVNENQAGLLKYQHYCGECYYKLGGK